MAVPNRKRATRKSAGPRKTAQPILRFAHPFFTPTPPEQRPEDTVHGQRLLDLIQGKLNPIPPLHGDGMMTLANVIGKDASDQIAATGQITLHLAGDTGVPETDHETMQVLVADAMAKDYDVAHPEKSPAFFLHLGDVIYGPNPDSYRDQFYRAYMHYPGKIVAVPGNHDGEAANKMAAFQKYFCATSPILPPIAGSIYRQTMTQPGVYWYLDAPFIQIIGLYSNSAENPGYIAAPQIGQAQKQWLVKTLKNIKSARGTNPRKALLFATHHPPYSSGGHSGSTQMLADIDDACTQAGIRPDVFFSGHAHSIQRFTRTMTLGGQTAEVPYIISGCGGHGGQSVDPIKKTPGMNPTYDFGYKGWGYSMVKVTSSTLTITSFGVDQNGASQQVDTTTVNLK